MPLPVLQTVTLYLLFVIAVNSEGSAALKKSWGSYPSSKTKGTMITSFVLVSPRNNNNNIHHHHLRRTATMISSNQQHQQQQRQKQQHSSSNSNIIITAIRNSPNNNNNNDDDDSPAEDNNKNEAEASAAADIVDPRYADDPDGVPLFDTNENRGATLFGLEPRADYDYENADPLDNGLQFTGPVIMLASIYVTICLFLGEENAPPLNL